MFIRYYVFILAQRKGTKLECSMGTVVILNSIGFHIHYILKIQLIIFMVKVLEIVIVTKTLFRDIMNIIATLELSRAC